MSTVASRWMVALSTLLLAAPSALAQSEGPAFGGEAEPARGVATLLSAGTQPCSPLSACSFLAAGDYLRLWDLRGPVLAAEERTPFAAASVVLSSPLQAWPLLLAGEVLDSWTVGDVPRLRPLDWHLAAVRDDALLPDAQDGSIEAIHERLALREALIKSLRAPFASFQRVALINLSARDLVEQPHRHRGAVVLLDGRVRRVQKVDLPPQVSKGSVDSAYEIWVDTQVGGVSRPVCLFSPVLPEGLRVGEYADEAPYLALSGYFFKRRLIQSGEGVKGHPDRSVALLIGRAIPVLGPQARAPLAASAVTLAGLAASAPLGSLEFLQAGQEADCWTIEDPRRVPPLERLYLGAIRDGQPLPNGMEELESESQEALAYFDAVEKTNRCSLERFVQSALPDVTYRHVFNEPARYRGQVVRIEGRVRRITRFEPMYMVQQAGVKDLYEIWLLNDQFGAGNPVCLITTTLPKGIRPMEQVRGDVNASAVGYFFKRYRYKAADTTRPNEFRDAPLLIGQLFHEPTRPKTEEKWTSGLLPLFFTILIGTLVIVLGLTWIFRRSDGRLHRRLQTRASAPFENLPEALSPQTPKSEKMG